MPAYLSTGRSAKRFTSASPFLCPIEAGTSTTIVASSPVHNIKVGTTTLPCATSVFPCLPRHNQSPVPSCLIHFSRGRLAFKVQWVEARNLSPVTVSFPCPIQASQGSPVHMSTSRVLYTFAQLQLSLVYLSNPSQHGTQPTCPKHWGQKHSLAKCQQIPFPC